MAIPTNLSGDPDLIAARARTYKSTAQRLKRAADDLADLTDDDTYVSLAIDGVRLKALDARAATEAVSVRYDGAADALSQYAVDLRAAQDRAQRAANAFFGSNGQRSAARRAMDEAEAEMQANIGQADLVQAFVAAKAAFDSIVSDTASAMAEYNAAVEDKNQAAGRAAHAIGQAMADAGLQDNLFEAISGLVQDAYEWAQVVLGPIIEEIYAVLQEIAPILNVIAVIVSVVSTFIPFLAPLAGLLQGLALAVSILLFVCSASLFLLGRGSLGTMLMDGLGLVINIFTAGAGGSAIKTALGAASPAVVASQNMVPTLFGQVMLIRQFGPSAIQLTAAGAEVTLGGTELLIDGMIDMVPDFGPDNLDLAPSTAGSDWNAPPTPQVESIFTMSQDFAAVELAPESFEQFASARLQQPFPVVASV